MRWLLLALLLTGCTSQQYIYKDAHCRECPAGTYPVQSVVGPACVDNDKQYMGVLDAQTLEVPMRLRLVGARSGH
jgi:hypothetical protein